MTTLPPLERGIKILELAASCPEGFTWTEACACLGDVSTATVARVLKVLTERDYLCQENGRYLSGKSVKRLVPSDNARELLLNHGATLSKEFSARINESCVTAVYNGDVFIFTGVQIIEGSMGYAGVGTIIEAETRGHIFAEITHATQNLKAVKQKFESGQFVFKHDHTAPSWDEYKEALQQGIETGVFFEYGWCRKHSYRMAVPVFDEKLALVGAFMCGYHDKKTLHARAAENLEYLMEIMSRIPGYRSRFKKGLENLKQGSL